MPRRSSAVPRPVAVLLAGALVAFPSLASGQGRRPPTRAGGWAPVEVGVHGGYDYTSRGSVLGAQIRIPLHPSGYVELVPNGDVTFLPRLREYMAGADLLVISGGRRGGLYAGGGVTWRNTLNGLDGGRSTRRFPTVVAGVKAPALFGAPVSTQLEVRWIRVDTDAKPKLLIFGINVPMWGWSERGRR